MRAAPEMSPTLDDALRALDGFPGRPANVPAACAFLNQLDDVRDVPAVVLDQAQAVLMEGAYQAGVRCADESGHVLVVSLPVFLELMQSKTVVSERTFTWTPPAWSLLLFIAGACATCSLAAFGLDEDPIAGAWLLFGAIGWALLAWALERGGTFGACSCGQYQHADLEQHEPECTRQAPASRCVYPECFCTFERMVAGCQSPQK